MVVICTGPFALYYRNRNTPLVPFPPQLLSSQDSLVPHCSVLSFPSPFVGNSPFLSTWLFFPPPKPRAFGPPPFFSKGSSLCAFGHPFFVSTVFNNFSTSGRRNGSGCSGLAPLLWLRLAFPECFRDLSPVFFVLWDLSFAGHSIWMQEVFFFFFCFFFHDRKPHFRPHTKFSEV